MNFLPPRKKHLKTTLKATIASLALAGMAGSAMANDAQLQFSVQSNATRSIGSAATAFERGEFSKSVSFSKYALKQGLKKSRKTAAYNNLCAALGVQAKYEDALDACNKALNLKADNWRALSNRAVIYSLTGNEEQARADMQAAILLASDNPKLVQNIAILG